MNEMTNDNISTTNASNNSHQTLLINHPNVKLNKNFDNQDLEMNKKKSKINRYKRLIKCVIILGLLFVINISLTIFLFLDCYLRLNHLKKTTNEDNTRRIIRNVINEYISYKNSQNKTTEVNLVPQAIMGVGRARYDDKAVYYDYEY